MPGSSMIEAVGRLELEDGSMGELVFGNAMFEDDSVTSPSTPDKSRLPGYFENEKQQTSTSHDAGRRLHTATPDQGRGGAVSRRAKDGHMQDHYYSPPSPSEYSGAGTQDYGYDDPALMVARTQAGPQMSFSDRSVGLWESEMKQLIGARHRAEAVLRPAPSDGLIKCYVKRVKNFFGTHCSFQMYLENGDVFLLAARRRKKLNVTSYMISTDMEDTGNCLAKLKANFTGTEYMLWGKSDNPKVNKGYANEQLCINFKQTAFTSSGSPRTMFTALPLPEAQWQSNMPDGSDSLSNSLEAARRGELPDHLESQMATLCTKPPEFDETTKAYTLDFKGRVKEASVKNFQLVQWNHNTADSRGSEVMLQFGKIVDDLYALDFAYPLNMEVAFAIALATIDTKLCYSL